jgi:hypothetical protein
VLDSSASGLVDGSEGAEVVGGVVLQGALAGDGGDLLAVLLLVGSGVLVALGLSVGGDDGLAGRQWVGVLLLGREVEDDGRHGGFLSMLEGFEGVLGLMGGDFADAGGRWLVGLGRRPRRSRAVR